MASHDTTSSAGQVAKQQNKKQPGKRLGRPIKGSALSPNGVDKELERERARKSKRRKKTSRGHTVWVKRAAELFERKGRKLRKDKRRDGQEVGAIVRRRLRCVRYYSHWHTQVPEKDAAQRAASKFGCSVATVRHWERLQRTGGAAALLPKPYGPRNPQRCVAQAVEHLVVALRHFHGWNEKRMAEELKQRGLANISHTTVGHIFDRYHLPTRTYHGKARSEGMSYRRYEKKWPNAQWHMDFAQISLDSGEVVLLVVVVDDYSRFCLACEVIEALSAEAALLRFRALCRRYGLAPQEMVTDNGRAFMSVYEDVETSFGAELAAHHTRHFRTAPYYPEGNGKAEAMVKILKHEALNRTFATVEVVRSALADFQNYYNFYRLHGSLGYTTPAARYWGVATPHNHGLAGLSSLPPDLMAAYPPAADFQPPVTDPTLRRQALALVPAYC